MVQPLTGQSADDYVEVYDEPDHVTRFVNEFVHVYHVRIAPGQVTLWHRHTRDTIYLALGAARAGERLPDNTTFTTEVPCGAAVCREHAHEPLIHQVTNEGDAPFFLVGVEAHATPPQASASTVLAGLAPALVDVARFQVFRIGADSTGTFTLPAFSLLVAASTNRFDVGQQAAAWRLEVGDVRWLEAATTLRFAAPGAAFVIVPRHDRD